MFSRYLFETPYPIRDSSNEHGGMFSSVLSILISPSVREHVLRTLYRRVRRRMQQWQHGQMDNFSYLMVLNAAAGRSYHDVSRYPVFPWVLYNYGEKENGVGGESNHGLDLNDPTNYRDLSKPMGALNEDRFRDFRQRCEGMVRQQNGDRGILIIMTLLLVGVFMIHRSCRGRIIPARDTCCFTC